MSNLIILLAVSTLLTHARLLDSTRLSSLHARVAASQQIPIACFNNPTPPCICPTDLFGDSQGVLINFYPGYQCAYPGGACTWNDSDGVLQNVAQTNCPDVAPCPSSGCVCPTDLNDDNGVLINQFTGYQCAYMGGACTWDFVGNLQNTMQTNCPSVAACVAPSS